MLLICLCTKISKIKRRKLSILELFSVQFIKDIHFLRRKKTIFSSILQKRFHWIDRKLFHLIHWKLFHLIHQKLFHWIHRKLFSGLSETLLPLFVLVYTPFPSVNCLFSLFLKNCTSLIRILSSRVRLCHNFVLFEKNLRSL